MLLSTADPPIEFTTAQCQTLTLACPVTLYFPGNCSDAHTANSTANGGTVDSGRSQAKTSENKTSKNKTSKNKTSESQTTGNTLQSLTAFTATAHHLTLIKKTEEQQTEEQPSAPTPHLKDCHLVLSVSLEQYQQILDRELFHLKPEVRGPLHQVDFWPDSPILLELGLQPYIFQNNNFDDLNDAPISIVEQERAIALLSDLLSLVEPNTPPKNPNAGTVATPQKLNPKTSPFIQDLLAGNTPAQPSLRPPDTLRENQREGAPASPLNPAGRQAKGKGGLRRVAPWQTTDGWLCRSVQQRQGDETVGYATLWAYATPEQTEPVRQSGQTAMEAIATLLQHTSDAVQSELEQHLPQVKQSLSLFSDELITALEQVDWETLLATDADAESDTELTDSDRESVDIAFPMGNRPVSEVVKQFFDEDDWSYIILENLEEPTRSAELTSKPSPSQEGDQSSQNSKSKIQNPLTRSAELTSKPSPSQEGNQSSDRVGWVDDRKPNNRSSSPGSHQTFTGSPNHYTPNPPLPHFPTPKLFQLAFHGDAGRWTCLAQADDEAQQVVFYSLCPISVPNDRSGPMAEFILRVNDGLVIGNFELDMDQGDIRYKTSLDTEGDRLSTALMERLVYANVNTMDTYLPGIIAVLSGDCSPVEAIAQVEQTIEH